VKSTEEKELETIEHFRQKLSKKLKQNQESFKKAVVAPSYVPAHSKNKPTQPQEFKFKTDDRIKNQSIEVHSTIPVDYVRMLRSDTNKTSVSFIFTFIFHVFVYRIKYMLHDMSKYHLQLNLFAVQSFMICNLTNHFSDSTETTCLKKKKIIDKCLLKSRFRCGTSTTFWKRKINEIEDQELQLVINIQLFLDT
jgi:hypothetical protein